MAISVTAVQFAIYVVPTTRLLRNWAIRLAQHFFFISIKLCVPVWPHFSIDILKLFLHLTANASRYFELRESERILYSLHALSNLFQFSFQHFFPSITPILEKIKLATIRKKNNITVFLFNGTVRLRSLSWKINQYSH